ncbi:MAG: ArsR family transcriptional regulator [Eubacteriales bacterium]
MDRDFGAEIDALQKQIEELTALIHGEHISTNDKPISTDNNRVGNVEKMKNMHPDPVVMAMLNEIENSCGESGDSGRISYIGVFASGGHQSTWIKHKASADELLTLIENKTAEKVLACIGNSDRLNILLAILKKPMTVSQLVTEGGYGSTGQVYHHLKPLMAADLVIESDEKKGYYVIQPHRVQGIIMLLAGISDMVDPQFTQGSWE